MQVWIVWLIIAGILVMLEMLALTFYMLWLGIGALAAAVTALWLPDSFLLQVIIGCITAVLLTVFTKPLTRRIRASKGFKDQIDQLIGRQGIVMEPIEPGNNGIVKVGGDMWSASSYESLSKDEKIVVIKRSNTMLEVQKWGGV